MARRWVQWTAALGALVLLGAYFQRNNPFAFRPHGSPDHCRSNGKNTQTALEMYARDHQGHYPPRLSQLPESNYLKVIPTCPASASDEFSATYEVSQEPQAYTFSCPVEHKQEGQRRFTSRD